MEQSYKAVLLIEISCRRLVDGKPKDIISDKTLRENGIKPKSLYSLTSDNLPDLLASLKQILGQFDKDGKC